ncbi:MAG: hypothetical protein ABI822_11645 [Bryobacteraceae bacterium]
MKRLQTWIFDSIAICILTSILIWPCFKLVYLDRFSSIESTFIADGRMLLGNLPHSNWQPLWYCGTRADYVYPPGLRYGTAILTKLLHTSPPRAYHIYIAVFYVLGILAVYLMVRIGNGSRLFAWLAAAATALLSPSFLFLPEYLHDSGFLAPQRLHALITYGEGPHISALSVLPYVFAAALLWMRKGNPAWIAAAAIAAAVVVTNNFYGATALAILFPFLTWGCFVSKPSLKLLLSFAGIAALAYGLTAWWLVPSYIRVTSENLKLVAEQGNSWSVVLLIAVVVLFAAVTWKLPARFKSSYGLFVWGGFLILSLYVMGHQFFHFQVAGESSRIIPEFDLFFILAAIETLRYLWNWKPAKGPAWLPRVAVGLIVAASCWPVPYYLQHAYLPFPEDHNWRDRVEYKTTKWIHENLPGQRVLATGSIRFWYDVWFDLPQLDGGSQQGVLNLNIVNSQPRMMWGNDMELVRLWLKALGTDAAVIPQENSKELYHDLAPELLPLWRKEFPVLRDDGEGNIFYRVDRRVQGIVRIVDAAGMKGLSRIPAQDERIPLRNYVNAIEAEPRAPGAKDRLHMERPNTDEMRLQATVEPGEAVLVEESFDPAWHAYSNGKSIPIEKDPVGFMLLHSKPGTHSIVLIFEPTLEIQAGHLLSFLSVLIAAAIIVVGYRR